MTLILLALACLAWGFIGGMFLRDWHVRRGRHNSGPKPEPVRVLIPAVEISESPEPSPIREVWEDLPAPRLPGSNGHRGKRGKKRGK